MSLGLGAPPFAPPLPSSARFLAVTVDTPTVFMLGQANEIRSGSMSIEITDVFDINAITGDKQAFGPLAIELEDLVTSLGESQRLGVMEISEEVAVAIEGLKAAEGAMSIEEIEAVVLIVQAWWDLGPSVGIARVDAVQEEGTVESQQEAGES